MKLKRNEMKMILIIMNCILLLTTAFNISKQCKIYEMTTVNCHCIGNEVNFIQYNSLLRSNEI